MAHIFNVYISSVSYKPEYQPPKRVGVESVGYHRKVLADTRQEALDKCMADIREEFPKLRGTRLSVFVGRKGSVSGSASRLMPLTIPIERS